MSDCKFGQDEDKMIYFFLLSSLRKEHFEAVGIEEKKPYSYLTDEEKINIIANLTSKQKAIIRRDFLIANFKNAYGNNAIASLLLDFAQNICPTCWQTSRTDIMKCMRSVTNVSKRKKPFFWCRNKQSRKRSNLTNSNPKQGCRPKNSHKRKILQLNHNQ